MKRECPSLFAALLVSLLVNVLLRSQTAYRPRAGLAAAPLCALLLAAVGWLFARCWRLACDPVLRLLFGALLVFSSVLELLRLWQLADRLYPGAITLSSDRKVCAYIGEYFTHAQDVFGHKFSTRELELVESFVSSVQAAYRNYDIFSNPDMLNRMKAQADLIDDCGDDAVFYFTYKVCSGILRCAIEHFPEEKTLAYDIVGKMNKYQERYDGISFVGKDKCHG